MRDNKYDSKVLYSYRTNTNIVLSVEYRNFMNDYSRKVADIFLRQYRYNSDKGP